ncbi:hypothetical protein SLA2020_267620 [Shorea laevis]
MAFGTDGSVQHPVERPLERELEQMVLSNIQSNGHWNGNWNGWFCSTSSRTAIGMGIGSDGFFSHPIEWKTPCSNGKLHK